MLSEACSNITTLQCLPETVSYRGTSPIGIADYGVSEIADTILYAQFGDALIPDRQAVP